MKTKYYNISKITGLFLFLALFSISGCLGDFEEINRNKLRPTEKEIDYDGVASGGYFTDFQKRIIPTRGRGEGTDRINEYQITLNLASDSWAGYFSPTLNKFNNGNNFTTYYMIVGWVDYTYTTMYRNIVNPWFQIRQQTHEVKKDQDGNVTFEKKDIVNQSTYSIAQIIKIMGLHKTTDMFGPLPYSKVGSGSFLVPYDSQEVIYRSFFKELQEAIETLNIYANNQSTLLKNYDGVYHGDVNKWMKLGNSLMLRLAMRVRYADESLAREYANKAITNPGGLIENVADIAMLKSEGNFEYDNSLKLISDGYNDTRMGATIQTYLKGFNDPRIASYFRKGSINNQNDYFALRAGIPMPNNVKAHNSFSLPNIESETPVYWFKASETYFLKAEAALYGLIGGNAEEFYNQGIKTSFQENGVALGDYLTRDAIPASFEDPFNSAYNAPRPSGTSKKWSSASTQEQHLEQIITQKYLAIFPDGQEAWSEWRRTGYPKQILVFENKTNQGILTGNGSNQGVRRFPFPQSEKIQNTENVAKAGALLNGPDNSATRLWWDKNPNIN
ncbi:Susd and RagB outer membrane lipoprotein [Candidatus Ornithobacterium hominis]|uniref:RagB/SusD family nutrient uptake outer membrane protein n=1 Tax=Candidatus Ornithobacterium hominis TaxID=2497989 RepID=UPI000E5C498D|nr:RagB/SusD family nutrient uptake outer membrane protein [Candidatus Ornithobacterium hominis]SZD71865.1 Susd and RagB outer membrane lipoprotein [Candidatus Ornithobacterium hominis]